jgi:hypothetical protein
LPLTACTISTKAFQIFNKKLPITYSQIIRPFIYIDKKGVRTPRTLC